MTVQLVKIDDHKWIDPAQIVAMTDDFGRATRIWLRGLENPVTLARPIGDVMTTLTRVTREVAD